MIHPFQGIVPVVGQRVLAGASALVLGDVQLGDDASVWFNCVVRGDVNYIRIGARSNIQDNACLHVTHGVWPLVLEEEVSIAHNVMLHGCVIRRGALVGMSSTVMDGAEIGEQSIVGANSLVTNGTKVPPGSLVMGTPAKVVRALTPEERAKGRYLAEKYTTVAATHKAKFGNSAG